MRLPAGSDATVRAMCGLLSSALRPARRMRYGCLGTPDQDIGAASTNDPIELDALGGCPLQGCVPRRRNAEVLIDRPTTELQLQKPPGVVIGDRRHRG